MKMAKASSADMEMAMKLCSALEAMDSRFFPGGAEGDNDPEDFDLQRAEACLREAMTSLILDWMSPEEVRAAVRFCETCDDDEGYDVPRAMMKQLEAFGLVVDKKFGRFEQTSLLLDIREALEAEITAAS